MLDLVPGSSPSEVNTVRQSLVHQMVNESHRTSLSPLLFFSVEMHAIKMYNMISLELQFVFNLISFVCITIGSFYLGKVLYHAKPYLRKKKIGSRTKPLSIIRTYLFNALSVFYYYFGT